MSDCHCTKYIGKRACIHDLRLMVDEQADTIDQQAETIARVKDIVDNYSEPHRHSACVKDLLNHLHFALRDVSESADTASDDSEHRQDDKPVLTSYSWPAMRDAIQRVRYLHQRGDYGECVACAESCSCCPYPCPTIKALDGEQE